MARGVHIIRRKKFKIWGTDFLNVASDLLNAFYIKPMKKARAEELQDARIQKLLQDRKIGEINHGIKSNQLVLLDIKIEQEKLKLRELQNRVGDPDRFAPPMGEV